MGKFTQIILSIIGATIGFFIGGPAGAAKGWFIGSTIGGLLSLPDTHTTTSGARITDFKTMSSKYGIPINRGFGTVRLASNIIWQGAVTEYEDKETTCIKTDGFFFGLGSTRQCSTKITFKYKQSAAFAFAEGPATSLSKIWADGELIYDTSNLDRANAIIRFGLFSRDTSNSAPATQNFKVYLGTTTQPIDPIIRQSLGADATAFRSIVYAVGHDIDLDSFGYRLPVLTAEVSFNGGSITEGNLTLDIPIAGNPADPDFDVLGSVAGHPELTLGVNNADSGSISVYNAADGSVFFETSSVYPDGAPTGYVQVSPVFYSIRKVVLDSKNHFGPFNIRTNRQIYIQEFDQADFVNMAYSAYDIQENVMWVSFSGGGAIGFQLHYDQTFMNKDPVYKYWTKDAYEYTGPLVGLNAGFSNGGGTNDESREIFAIGGRAYWLVDGAGGVWINRSGSIQQDRGTVIPARSYARVQFNDATNVASVANWTYEPIDDTFIFYVDTAGTSPTGLYKVDRSALFATPSTVKLPLSTDAGKYLSVAPVDQSAFQFGPVSGVLRAAQNSNDLYVIDTVGMVLNETILSVPGGLGTIGTVALPGLDSVRGGSFNIYYYRGTPGAGQTLDGVVSNLMTTIDGDPKERLTVSDIDVSELTGDTVRGFPLIQQQTVRNAITPLQQFYFFDVVESDGKLKFVKRPQTQSFAMTEDELSAHEYGKTSSKVLVPVEYERQTEMELPRELIVNYTDIDLDYNQGTQRYRKQYTESHSNTFVVLPIVMDSTEAAQTAEKLLNSTWSERVAPFKFKTGMKYSMVEPTDTGTITMNDGRVHTIRIIEANQGANSMMEFVAVNETSSVYSSSATGSDSSNAPQVIDNSQVIVRAFDIPAIFLDGATEGQTGVVVGLGYYGDEFGGGSALILGSGGGSSDGGAVDETQGMTFGVSQNAIGHVNGPEAANIFDYETTIVMDVEGGGSPTSKTESEALNADPSGLLIVGREIMAFTDVSCTVDITATGTDISFANSTSSIDSVSTDFQAAGFEIGMVLRISGADNNDNTTYWEISGVAQYKLTMTNAPTNESAGNEVVISLAEKTCTFSGGLLRGLYGTEEFMYHPKGEEITLAENLFFAPVSSSASTEGMVTVLGVSSSTRTTNTDSVEFTNAALKPWSPVDVEATDLVNDIQIDWVRRDKRYGGGIVDTTGAVDNSEVTESWEIDIIDAYTEGSETDIVRTVSATTSTYTYTEAQQVADWGAARNVPFMVEVYQLSDAAGRGFRRRTVLVRDNDYAPIGENFATETPGAAYTLGTDRLASGTHLIEGSGDISANALRVATTVDTEYAALSFDEAAGCSDVEAFTVVEMQAEGLSGLTAGVILRGRGFGSTDFYGAVVGLGGDPTDLFGIQHYINGGVSSTFSASTAFSWTVGTKYAIRARYYKNRIQGKVWEYGDPEPEAWQLSYYDNGVGPEYGWTGPFAYKTGNDPLYHYFAWAHRGLTAA